MTRFEAVRRPVATGTTTPRSQGRETGAAAGAGPAIDRDSKLPLYHQLYEILRRQILSGAWRPGDLIPPETELVGRYGVSRITVRRVLDQLVRERLIYRQQGRGTFVAHPTLEQGLGRIVSFTEDMRQRGYQPGTRVLSAGLAPAPPDIAEHLQVELGEELVKLERLRLADGEPMSIEEAYLVHRYCPGILHHDFATQPLRETLEREHNLRLIRARQVIRAATATARLARLLSVPGGSPLLLIERVSFSQRGIPVEFLRVRYRADRYCLYSELQG